MDKYVVGEHSQAYGLTIEQARDILPVNSVYVPTIAHNETFEYTNSDGEVENIEQLNKVIRAIRKVDSVYDVNRKK